MSTSLLIATRSLSRRISPLTNVSFLSSNYKNNAYYSTASNNDNNTSPQTQKIMTLQKLTAQEQADALAKLSAWSLVDNREAIKRTIIFKDFNEAFGFMSRVALYADKHDHHPEWFNVMCYFFESPEFTVASLLNLASV
jgi:hypothetical protein